MTTLLLLLLPSMLFLAGVFALPLVRYLWLSFHADSVMTGLVAIPNDGANWDRLFHDLRYWQDLGQTFRFAVASVTLELLLGLAIALLLNQPQRGRALIRTTSLIPWALPTTVMALGWRWIFNTPYGPVNRLLRVLLDIHSMPSVNHHWLGSPRCMPTSGKQPLLLH